MKRGIKRRGLLALGLLALLAILSAGRADEDGLKPATTILLQDEGASQGRIKTLNCVGAGVACTTSGIVGTITAAGGGGGSANTVEKSIAITSAGMTFSATVTGQAWVTASSVIVCGVLGTAADGLTPESIAVAGLGVTVSNRVVGTGFDLTVENAYGLEGTVRVQCIGA